MKNDPMKKIADALLGAESIDIVTHIMMDGDALGSAAALCLALRKEGKAANLDFNYEKWVKLEAVRDWRALETSWSNANSADYNGGEVYLTPQK